MNLQLPEKSYYPIEEFSAELGCSVEDILQYGIEGQIALALPPYEENKFVFVSSFEIQDLSTRHNGCGFINVILVATTPETARGIRYEEKELSMEEGGFFGHKITAENLFITNEERSRFLEECKQISTAPNAEQSVPDNEWSRTAIKEHFTALSKTQWDSAFTRDKYLQKTLIHRNGNKCFHNIGGVINWLVAVKGKYSKKDIDRILETSNQRKQGLPPIGKDLL